MSEQVRHQETSKKVGRSARLPPLKSKGGVRWLTTHSVPKRTGRMASAFQTVFNEEGEKQMTEQQQNQETVYDRIRREQREKQEAERERQQRWEDLKRRAQDGGQIT